MAPTQKNTNNKTVLITGATRGIGLGLVQQYQNSGWNVIGAARNLNNADKLKALEPYKIVQLDTSDEESISRAAKELEGETIDLLINNAGIFDNDTLASLTKESMMRVFETNTVGPLLVSRAFAPRLRAAASKNGLATVAQVTSTLGSIMEGGIYGNGMYAYRTSKAALNMVNSCLSLDLKSDNVIAVVICPGHVATDLNGYTGAVQVVDSASGIAKVIAGLKTEDTGKFFRYDGTSLSW